MFYQQFTKLFDCPYLDSNFQIGLLYMYIAIRYTDINREKYKYFMFRNTMRLNLVSGTRIN